MGGLAGKIAVVTGAASGIGHGVARLLAEEGAGILACDVNAAGLRRLAAAIEGAGGSIRTLAADVSLDAACRQVVDAGLAAFGRLDVLVNSAGTIRRATVVETSEAEWDRTLAVNLKSIFLMSRAVIPVFARQGGGAIVNLASNWGLSGGPRAAAYCASKGGVVLLTKAMAIDHGPERVRVNCVCPGDVDTPMLRDEARQLGEPVEAFLAESARNPLGRCGTPEDVARAVLYLASDQAAFVTGAALVVDGGFEAG